MISLYNKIYIIQICKSITYIVFCKLEPYVVYVVAFLLRL
jgi:hypothetical protein